MHLHHTFFYCDCHLASWLLLSTIKPLIYTLFRNSSSLVVPCHLALYSLFCLYICELCKIYSFLETRTCLALCLSFSLNMNSIYVDLLSSYDCLCLGKKLDTQYTFATQVFGRKETWISSRLLDKISVKNKQSNLISLISFLYKLSLWTYTRLFAVNVLCEWFVHLELTLNVFKGLHGGLLLPTDLDGPQVKVYRTEGNRQTFCTCLFHSN